MRFVHPCILEKVWGYPSFSPVDAYSHLNINFFFRKHSAEQMTKVFLGVPSVFFLAFHEVSRSLIAKIAGRLYSGYFGSNALLLQRSVRSMEGGELFTQNRSACVPCACPVLCASTAHALDCLHPCMHCMELAP